MQCERNFVDVGKDIEIALKNNSNFLLLLGAKANGKTYGSIYQAIKKYFETGKISVYLRTHANMIKKSNIEFLLHPHLQTIRNLSHGKYNNVKFSANKFILYNTNDTSIRPEIIMITRSISAYTSQTGADVGEIQYIIFDEIFNSDYEIPDLFNKFMIVHSNLTRGRKDILTIMLGNTLTRSSNFIENFKVNLKKIEQNTITVIKNKNKETLIVVDYVQKLNFIDDYYSRFDNDKIKMITDGTFSLDEYKGYNYITKKTNPICRIRIVDFDTTVDIDFCYNNECFLKIHKPNKLIEPMCYYSTSMKMSKNKIILRYADKFFKTKIEKCLITGMFYTDSAFSVDDLKIFLKHLPNSYLYRKV